MLVARFTTLEALEPFTSVDAHHAVTRSELITRAGHVRNEEHGIDAAEDNGASAHASPLDLQGVP